MTDDPGRPEFVIVPAESADPDRAVADSRAGAETPAPGPPWTRRWRAALVSDRRWRWGAWIAFAALLATAAVVARHQPGDDTGGSAPSTIERPSATPGRPPASTAPWPRAPGGCGSEVLRPLVSAAPISERTGLRLTIGAVRTVDVDTGSTSAPRVVPATNEVVAQLATRGLDTYALVVPCAVEGSGRVVRVGPGGQRQVGTGRIDRILAGGGAVWGVTAPANTADGSWTLDPLDGGRPRSLPPNIEPVGVLGDVVVGRQRSAADPDAPPMISIVAARTGRVLKRFGPAGSVTVGSGTVLWAGPACPAAGGCPLHSYEVSTARQRTRAYTLPAGGTFTDGVLSPDGRRLAFQLPRAAPDPRYDIGVPAPPYDIAVLQLDSGRLDVVPGVELSGASSVAATLTFSADARWLAITLDDGRRSRLLVWRPGLAGPMESSADLPDPVRYTPAVAAAAQ